MVGKSVNVCAKCGVTSRMNPSLSFHRFPRPSKYRPLKAKVWAKYCFPNYSLTDESLKKLNGQHKMLCSNHFDNLSYTNGEKKRLHRYAIPRDAETIMAELRDEMNAQNQQQQQQQPMVTCGPEQSSLSSVHITPESNIQLYPTNPTLFELPFTYSNFEEINPSPIFTTEVVEEQSVFK